MATVNPYLTFNSNCEEAFNFYKNIFGGEFSAVMRFKDIPGPHPDSEGNKIMHMALPLAKDTLLMGSDTPESMGRVITGSNVSISLQTETEAETDKIFNGLAQGGKITMPLAKSPWNAYFGMLTDKYGFNWILNCDLNPNN
jgi:PhnB protein